MARAFIGIGSNIKPQRHIREALRLLAQSVHIEAISTFYQTAAIGRPQQPDYYNGVALVRTELKPAQLKARVLHGVEAALGRVRSADKYAARTIDLDLLVYDQGLAGDEPFPPDPHILERGFLAIALHELAPDLVLAGCGRKIAEVARALGNQPMQALPEFSRSLREDVLGSG